MLINNNNTEKMIAKLEKAITYRQRILLNYKINHNINNIKNNKEIEKYTFENQLYRLCLLHNKKLSDYYKSNNKLPYKNKLNILCLNYILNHLWKLPKTKNEILNKKSLISIFTQCILKYLTL